MNLILDNIIFQLQKSGGISVYWEELIVRFLNDINLNINFIGVKKNNIKFNVNNLEFVNISNNIIISNDTIFGRIVPVNLKEIKNNFIFHSSYFRFHKKNKNVINVCSIYDFYQEIFLNQKYTKNVIMKKRAIKNADFFICISQHAKTSLLNLFPNIDVNHINVIYLAASSKFSYSNSEKENFLLFVGRREQRKNFNFVVQVLSKLPNYKLKIVGESLLDSEIIYLNSLIKNRWENIVFPNFDELNILYNKATALIHASSYEGFGLTVLEAMQAGCPVIALNNTSIPEVAGNAGILIDDLKIDDFVSAVEQISTKIDSYIKKGIEQAKKFSWDNTANETLNYYKEIYTKFSLL